MKTLPSINDICTTNEEEGGRKNVREVAWIPYISAKYVGNGRSKILDILRTLIMNGMDQDKLISMGWTRRIELSWDGHGLRAFIQTGG